MLWSWSEDVRAVCILSSDYFCYFFPQFELFQALLLSTYVDSRYLSKVTPPINFTFSDDSLFLYKILGGGHKPLTLLVLFVVFVVFCLFLFFLR